MANLYKSLLINELIFGTSFAVITGSFVKISERMRFLMFQFLANVLCKGAVFGIVGLGFGLIYTTTRVFHIAHAGVYVVSGYALYLGLSHWGMSLMLSIFLALFSAVVAGIVIEWAVYLPLSRRSASTAVVLISSIGTQIVLENAISLFFGNQSQTLRGGVEQTATFGTVILTYIQISQFIVGIGIATAFWIFLTYSRAGQICRAVSDDEILASVLGVKVTRVRLLVFSIGSLFAGIGCTLVSLDVGIDPHVGFPIMLAGAVACIIGGLRNFLAPIAGGLVLGITQSLVVWQTSTKWEEPVTFALLIMFLIFRTQGLFGINRRVDEI